MADYPPKKNTAYVFYVSLVSQANTKIMQVNPTLAAGDVKVATDDAAPANLGTLPVVDADFTKRVKVSMSAGEMNGDNVTIIFNDAAGAEWCDLTINIQTVTRQLTDLAYPATSGRSMVVDAAGLVDANTVKVGPTGTGTAQTAGDIMADTNDIQTRLPAALVGGRMDASVGAMAANVLTAASMAADASAEIADAVLDEDMTAHQTLGTLGQAIGDPVADTTTIYQSVVTDAAGANIAADLLTIDNLVDDLETRLGTPSDLGGGATVAANLVDIEAQTDDIGAAGAGLTAVPWNAAWDAQVESEVDDALVARFLDKLVIVNGTADSGSTTTMVDAARTEADADYWKGRIIHFTSGNISGQSAIITDFNAGTDTFTFAPAVTQAVSTQTYIILPGVSVWDDTLAEHLAAGSTGAALNAAGAAGDPWSTALPGAYGAGTAGKIVGDNVNATISSRASQATLDTLDDYVDTEVAAILAAVDTEVAAIKAVTDVIPNAGALTTIQADLDDIQTRIPAALASGNIKADILAVNGSTAAAASLAKSAAAIVRAAAIAGTLSTTQMTTDLTEATNDHYNGRVIIWTSGVLLDQATNITDYDGATKMLTYTAITEAPTAGDTFVIV